MRQTDDYEDQSGGLPLIYMALGVSAFVLMILVLVVTMNKDKSPSPTYNTQVQQEEVVTEDSSTSDSAEETFHEIGGDLVASDLDFWDMYPLEDSETEEEEEKTEDLEENEESEDTENEEEKDPSKDGKHVEVTLREGTTEWVAINPY